jgi:acyl-homoserine lactone acylase PvdQ
MPPEVKAKYVRTIQSSFLELQAYLRQGLDECQLNPLSQGCATFQDRTRQQEMQRALNRAKAMVENALAQSVPEWKSYMQYEEESNTKKLLFMGAAVAALYYAIK